MNSRIAVLLINLLFILSCKDYNHDPKYKTELYFGLSNSDGTITDSAWVNFKNRTIDKMLEGYTIFESKGYWTNEDGNTVHQDSRVLIYVHKKSETIDQKIDSIIQLYKIEFDQESVLKTKQEIDYQF